MNAIALSPTSDVDSPARIRCRTDLKILGIAILLNTLLFGAFLLLATPYYETNDDLSMQFIASGFYTGHPSEYLVFTSVLIGWPLKLLYTYWNGHNWYLGYLLLTHYLALIGFAFVIFSRRLDRLFVLLFIGFFLFAEIRILLRPQFTTTAFLAGMVGLLLLVDSLSSSQSGRSVKLVAGLFLFSLMCLIREPVAPMLLIIAFPFLAEGFGFKGWRRFGALYALSAILFIGLHGLNQWVYSRDPAWAEFSQYNALRGEIHGTELGRLVEKAGPVVGWNQNDTKMFIDSYYPESEIYGSVATMKTLNRTLKDTAKQQALISNFSALYLFLPKLLGRDAGLLMWLALLNGAGCLYFARGRRTRLFVTLFATYAILVLLCFYIRETARLPARLTYNMPLLLNAICLYWASRLPHQSRPERNWLENSVAALRSAGLLKLPWGALLPIWIAAYAYLLSEVTQNMWYRDAYHRNLKLASQKIPGALSALSAGSKVPTIILLPFNSILEQSPFFLPADAQPRCSLVPYGWLTHSPIFREILQQHALQPYSRSILNREDVFFLMDAGRWLEPLQLFYRDHYSLNVRFDSVLNTDQNPDFRDCQLHLYQAHTAKEP